MKKGNIKTNLTKQEMRGLRKLKKRVKENEIILPKWINMRIVQKKLKRFSTQKILPQNILCYKIIK